MRKQILAAGILLLGAPVVDARAPGATVPPGAASLEYYTPRTKLSLAGDLVLQKCDENSVIASSALKLVSGGAANTDALFAIDGAYLGSARQKRELAVELYENRTIKSLNATTSDRTGAVITNLVKIVGNIAKAVTGAGQALTPNEIQRARTQSPCNDRTWEALHLADQLRAAIRREQNGLSGLDPDDAEAKSHQIDLLARQLALVTTTYLTVSLNQPIKIGDAPSSGTIRWTLADLGKWFGNPDDPQGCTRAKAGTARYFPKFEGQRDCKSQAQLFAIDYSISSDAAVSGSERAPASLCLARNLAAASNLSEKKKQQERLRCARSIVLATPVPAKVALSVASGEEGGRKIGEGLYQQSPGTELDTVTVPMPQWGKITYLPLDVRLFQSRSVGMTFDQFGQRQTLKWNSEATTENATTALASASEAGLTTLKNLEGPTDTARWKAEIEELETRMKLNKLRLCEALIANGGTKCEPETD